MMAEQSLKQKHMTTEHLPYRGESPSDVHARCPTHSCCCDEWELLLSPPPACGKLSL